MNDIGNQAALRQRIAELEQRLAASEADFQRANERWLAQITFNSVLVIERDKLRTKLAADDA
jgi:regulator of replication initiation timing